MKKTKKEKKSHSAKTAKKDFGKKAIIFLIKFFAIYAIAQAAILIAPLGLLKEWIALIEASALGLQAQGNNILFNAHSFAITAQCTGLMSASVLAAIALSLKKPVLLKKIALIAAGAVLLFFINLFRVYLVLLAAIAFNPDAAGTLHEITWFAMAALIIVIWYYLTKIIAGAKAFAEML